MMMPPSRRVSITSSMNRSLMLEVYILSIFMMISVFRFC